MDRHQAMVGENETDSYPPYQSGTGTNLRIHWRVTEMSAPPQERCRQTHPEQTTHPRRM